MEIIKEFDITLFYFINQSLANAVFDFFCPVLRSKGFLAVCYLVFLIVIYQTFPKHFFKIVIAGALTFLLTDQISSSLIKPHVHRLRPCNDFHVISRLIIEHCGGGFSFVSSHAANSFGIAAFLSVIFREKPTTLFFATWASLVCFAQIYVGVHYPSDVTMGAVLGIIIGGAVGGISKSVFSIKTE